MVARFRWWRRCWRSPRGHKKLPKIFIGQLGPAGKSEHNNHPLPASCSSLGSSEQPQRQVQEPHGALPAFSCKRWPQSPRIPPLQPSPAQHSLVEGVRVVHIVPIGGQRVGERLTCGDRGRAALRDPSAGVGRGAPPPPQHGPGPGGGTETTPGGAPRCHDAVATLSRYCHDATPPALTVPLRHLGRAPLPSAAAQEVPEAPLAPRPTLPPRSVIGQFPQGERGDWPAPPRGPTPRLAERTRWRRRP